MINLKLRLEKLHDFLFPVYWTVFILYVYIWWSVFCFIGYWNRHLSFNYFTNHKLLLITLIFLSTFTIYLL